MFCRIVYASAGEDTRIALTLPKFSYTCGNDLTEALKALGMTKAFDPTLANFSKMTNTPGLSVGKVLSKNFIAIDEKGTQAAAANVVEL